MKTLLIAFKKIRFLIALTLVVHLSPAVIAQGVHLEPETIWDQFTFSSNFHGTDASTFSVVDCDQIRKAIWIGDTFNVTEMRFFKDTADPSAVRIYQIRTAVVKGSDEKVKSITYTISDMTKKLLLRESDEDAYMFLMLSMMLKAAVQSRAGTVPIVNKTSTSYEYKSPKTGKKATYTISEDSKSRTLVIKVKVS